MHILKKNKNIIFLLNVALIVIFYIIAFAIAFKTYMKGGGDWDFIAHWLWARSITNSNFYSALFNGHLANTILYANSFYFETLRAPLTGLIMAPFSIIGSSIGILLYFGLIIALLVYSLKYAAKHLNVNLLVLIALFLTPYTILFLLLLNGTEIVSMFLLVILIVMIIKKEDKSGIILALAGLAKYTNLIFIPLLLLLPKKERKKGFILFILFSAPWLLFNLVVYGNPFFSYTISAGAFSNGGAGGYFPYAVIAQSLGIILIDIIPAIIALCIVLLIFYAKSNKKKITLKIIFAKLNKRAYKVIICAIALGLFGWFGTSARGSINDLPRLGYLLYTTIGLFLAISFVDLIRSNTLKFSNFHKYAIVIFIGVYLLIDIFVFPYANYVFYGSNNIILIQAQQAILARNMTNCNMISNNWVYLVYDGYKAHFPYYYNYTVEHYPIIYFTSLGSNQSVINFKNVSVTYNYSDFFIELPKHYIC